MISIRKVITMGFAVASLLLLATATVSAVDGPAVMVTDYNVEPEVLMPGDAGTITVTIKNMDTKSPETETTTTGRVGGDSSTTQMTSAVSAEIETIRLSSSGEIEWLQKGSYRTKYYNVGSLGQGESISISLPIKADAHISDGTYFTEVYIEVDNGENVRFPVPVKVDSSEVEILVKDIPSEISLSESVTMEMEVANNRPNSVSGVIVSVKPLSTGLEFIPERIFIGDLGAYEKRAVDFTLQTFSTDATQASDETGTKRFAFEVTYKNGDNKHHNGLESSVFVTSIADVRLILVNAPESVFKDDAAKIEFDVANGMTKDIKAVSVIPAAIEGLRILPSEYFIGDMEVGDVFSASFDVYTSDRDSGDVEIPFELVFRDVDTDRRHEATGYEVHIEVKEQQKGGLPNSILVAVVIGIVVIVAVLLWIRVKRKRGR
ncbi:hypothetical protein C5S31_00895 [ANME-1 cluster archaeon GoMg2]|nr:hypothetical protein [ANME-1 cluster archaeon GoMg2]